jgi:hypothetical protein
MNYGYESWIMYGLCMFNGLRWSACVRAAKLLYMPRSTLDFVPRANQVPPLANASGHMQACKASGRPTALSTSPRVVFNQRGGSVDHDLKEKAFLPTLAWGSVAHPLIPDCYRLKTLNSHAEPRIVELVHRIIPAISTTSGFCLQVFLHHTPQIDFVELC